MLTKIL